MVLRPQTAGWHWVREECHIRHCTHMYYHTHTCTHTPLNTTQTKRLTVHNYVKLCFSPCHSLSPIPSLLPPLLSPPLLSSHPSSHSSHPPLPPLLSSLPSPPLFPPLLSSLPSSLPSPPLFPPLLPSKTGKRPHLSQVELHIAHYVNPVSPWQPVANRSS